MNGTASIAKVLGGCGVHNGMLYLRGVPEDFEEWGDYNTASTPLFTNHAHACFIMLLKYSENHLSTQLGIDGWDWDTVLQYYIKSENNADFAGNTSVHGNSGPMGVTKVDSIDPMAAVFYEACNKSALAYQDDFNDGNRTGCGQYQFNIRGGMRDSAAAAYLGRTNASSRPNLTIKLGSTATKIEVEANSTTATGVYYSSQFTPTWPDYLVKAKYEVILTAGAINTPKLLLLSGIGPAEDLTSLEIPVTADIPGVGNNLHDAPMTQVRWEIAPPPPGVLPFNACKTAAQQLRPECVARLEEYNTNRSGQFATPGISAGGFLVSPVSKALLGKPDIQITVLPSGQSWEVVESNATVMTWTLTLNNALSHGSVKLNNTKDPYAAPLSWASYFERTEDTDALLWAVKQVRGMAAVAPLKDYLWRETLPGPEISTSNDTALREYIRCGPNFVHTADVPCDTMVVNHFAGTCKMGDPYVDPDTVVDPVLRVTKVKNLRVADASVMPNLPSGNPHATVVMVAERAAEFVLQAHAKRMAGSGDIEWSHLWKEALNPVGQKPATPNTPKASTGLFGSIDRGRHAPRVWSVWGKLVNR